MTATISRVKTWSEHVPLTVPYTIAYKTTSEVDLFFIELEVDGRLCGYGCASPAPMVTGETKDTCLQALQSEAVAALKGQSVLQVAKITADLQVALAGRPAAQAAINMALLDALARYADKPLVELWGRRHRQLPTSVTIGIVDAAETVSQAKAFVQKGFRYLKVKIGRSVEEDVHRLQVLREAVGSSIFIRVDANQGYGVASTMEFWKLVADLNIELVEQPVPPKDLPYLLRAPAELLKAVAADESLHSPADAWQLVRHSSAVGIFNIKLMKCGGPLPALAIAQVAEWSGTELMWGCMDESVVSIAAALHTALACPMTRYLDLDGSFDLARDPFSGGFHCQDGVLRPVDKAGLGVLPV